MRFDPLTATVTLNSDPSGLQLIFGSSAEITPFQRTVIVGSGFNVGAPSTQQYNGQQWSFVSWSDGGARQHNAVASNAGSLSLVASYSSIGRLFADGFEAVD